MMVPSFDYYYYYLHMLILGLVLIKTGSLEPAAFNLKIMGEQSQTFFSSVNKLGWNSYQGIAHNRTL